MVEFFNAGGIPMIFVLVFAGTTLAVALAFAIRPLARTIPVLRGLSTASVFSILSGVASCLAAVFKNIPSNPQWATSPDLPLLIMIGLGESLAPAILGFSLLAVAWLLASLGARRLVGATSA